MTIPEFFPKNYKDSRLDSFFNIDTMLEASKERTEWTRKGMFAFVAWEWVYPFIDWINGRRVLEVMAGAGWLAKALKEKNVDVIATDDMSWHKERSWNLVTEVEELDAIAAVRKYGKEVEILIISWPYMDAGAYNTIKELAEVNPDCLIVYIGEGEGGCTADEMFFNHFNEEFDDKFDAVAGNFYSWWGIHDRLQLGRYQAE